MTEKEKLLRFQSKLNYLFTDLSLLKVALTHKSFAYESNDTGKDSYNERLEFLGDAILEHIISERLFIEKPSISEGDMTKKRAEIVCESSLCSAMTRIEGYEYIYLGKCEKIGNGNKKAAILADAFEAVIGAVYLDSNYDITKETVIMLLDKEINTVLQGGKLNIDYKTKLQEILQQNGSVKIEYMLLNEKGPEHDKTFNVELLFNDKKIGEGLGKNKKSAEQNAAQNALENM